jgi:PAS domain S-box-containing protein
MYGIDSSLLGIIFLVLGVAASLLTFVLLKVFFQTQPLIQMAPAITPDIQASNHSEAILIILSGGRLAYINQNAREWFNAWEDTPSLERLSRKVRPTEDFLGVCAAEIQARLYLEGRVIEAKSYTIIYAGDRATLVSMHLPQLVLDVSNRPALAGDNSASTQAIQVLNELNEAMATSLDLETTIKAILENIQRLIPSDFPEISVWQEETQEAIPYRLIGLRDADIQLEKISERYTLDQGYSGYLITQRKPLLVPDVEQFRLVKPSVQRTDLPINSYVGVPLLVANELIGTLELASLSKENFTQRDLEILQILCGPASIALHNALLYREEKQRGQELAGLAQLAQAVSSVGDTKNLFARLVESISPLLEVKLLGFLIYDENRHSLQGQLPFIGLHEEMIEYASSIIQANSQAEEIWLSQETIVTADAPNDPRVQAFGLDRLSLAASIECMVLVPLTSGGRMLGYLHVGNKHDGTTFNQDDLRLLAIIAGQAGSIVENAALVQQSEWRAQRAETLRRIASLTGSSATLDEILKYSVQDLARLLKADKAALFLADEGRGELRIQKNSLFGISPEFSARMGRISLDDSQFRASATGSQNYIFSDDAPKDPRVSAIYKPIYTSLALRSIVIVPLVVRDHGIGEILIGSQEPNFFVRSDLQTVSTAAGLLANIVERSALYAQTDETLRRRVDQLTALTRVGRELNDTLDLQYLLQRVYEEALQTTRADCGSIVLFEVNGSSSRNSIEEHTNGYPSRELLHLGDTSPGELLPLEKHVLDTKEALVIDDFDQESSLKDQYLLDLLPAHSGIRSELIVPIAYQEKIAGLIHLHASTPARFDQAALDITEALAIQASVALGSAYRYQEQLRRGEMLNRRVETLARLLETSQVLQSEQPLEQALGNIAEAIQAATQFDIVLISVYHPESGDLLRTAAVGIPEDFMAELWAHHQAWDMVEKILDPEYQIGRAYFIPYEHMPVMPADIHTVTVSPLVEDPSVEPQQRWHPEDMLIIPLYSSNGQPLGLISVDNPQDNLRPDSPAIETLEVFSGQAALVIENHNQMNGLKSRMQEIQGDLLRAQQAAEMAQNHLPILLHKDLEQTIAVQRLSQRAARIRAGMDIAEIVNRQGDRSSVLLAFGREILTHMDMDLAIVVEPSAHGPRLLHSLGRIPPGINIEALIGQRNPLHQCLQHGNNMLLARMDSGSEWLHSPLLQALEAIGFICLPIYIGARLDAAVLAISQTPLAPFTNEDEQLFTLLARLVAITLQNLNLLTEISQHLAEVNLLLDFSKQLSNLESDRILQILVESALHLLPTAQTSLVVLWDEKQGALVPRAASGYVDSTRIIEINYLRGEALPGRAFDQKQPIRLDEIDFPSTYDLSSENLLRYHKATGGRLPISCLAVPIQRAPNSDPLGVLVLENFKIPAAFPYEAQALVTSLTQQTALNLENSRLYRAAEQRASQLHALTGVSAIISSNLKPDQLIESLLDQLQAILPYKTGTLWLRQGDHLVVRVARGFVDSDQRQGLSVAVEDSALLKEMIATGLPILVGDVNKDPRFSSLVENPNPSWLGIPLIASGEVTGVIALEMDELNYYTVEHMQIATAFAGQAAVTLENASLYQDSVNRAAELDQRSSRLEMLNQFSKALSESLDPTELLHITVQEILQTIHCTCVSGLLFTPDGQVFLHAEIPQKTGDLPVPLPNAPLFDRLRETLGVFNCENVEIEDELAPLTGYFENLGTRSLLALSLATGSELHGVLFAHADHPYRFNADEIGLARTISNQAAIAIQNARLYAETRSLTNELDQRVRERTEQLARAHQRTETLLRLITELSASLDLEQVLTRTLNVLNQLIDAEHITVLLARSGERKLHHLASVGYQTPIVTEEYFTTLDSNQGLAGWIIKEHQPALIPDVKEDPRWLELPNVTTKYRSAIGVPLLIGGEALGALLFFHRRVDHFSMDQLDLVQAAANQVAIAVNNAELYRLIRDQAEDLGNMVRSQQVETQRSKAILEDVADGVLVTDENTKITLFNDSAEKILGLSRNNVVGKTLEYFTGLFGGAARTWMDTIRTWSQDPPSSRSGILFAEQITLEDERVVSIHLAPVSLRDTFLGTVSIFRDITHQVEVDRLKSEFVATVSHELRTPMTSIKGYVDILLMGAAGSLNEQQTHFLDIVKNNTDRLSVLVNDLLDISRIESGRLNLATQPVDLANLADQAVTDLHRRSEEDDKRMQIDLDLPRKLPRVVADPEQLRHILDNLLENAYYYTPENGHILVKICQINSQVQVDIKDDGIGIPAELQSRVFERFYRGEHPFVLSTSGTGLGLSIVQNLVEMQNGRIWLESSGVPGEGSTFSFTLPVHKPDKKR